MKKILLVIVIFSFFEIFSQDVGVINRRDQAVLINIDVVDTLGSNALLISWKENPKAYSYDVYRRELDEFGFSKLYPPYGTDTNASLNYHDVNVEPGKIYEYQIVARSYGKYNDNITMNFDGSGYQTGGINVTPPPKGRVILLMDSTLKQPLAFEIERLIEDLHKEGWGIIPVYMPRTEEFDSDAVLAVKDTVKKIYDNVDDVTTLFILGRIAVPYSGTEAWDGHPNHAGAWPADLFYGNYNSITWSNDNENVVENVSSERNKNRPGDGKYDISQLPNGSDVELQIGRVDFYKMNAFMNLEENITEIDLYKRYLNRDHDFRTGELSLNYQGVIQDVFKNNSHERFASSGWRNIAATVGNDNVFEGKLKSALSQENYLWTYACGAGSYTSASQIATTNDFANNSYDGIFMMLFGSYFGDWDSDNNLLRAPLCSNTPALTNSWTARPPWYYHHMTMGFPIGYSAKISQNNANTYIDHFYYDHPQYGDYRHEFAHRGTHMALMGDPTLTLYPLSEPPVTSVSVEPLGADIREVSWEPPQQEKLFAYNIYRSTEKYGIYTKLNDEPTNELSYVDENAPSDGTETFYMVRIVSIRSTNGGTMITEGPGMRASIQTSVNDISSLDAKISVSPNPATEHANIRITSDALSSAELTICDLQGRIVKSFGTVRLSPGTTEISWNFQDTNYSRLQPGVYFIKLLSGGKSMTEKLVVH